MTSPHELSFDRRTYGDSLCTTTADGRGRWGAPIATVYNFRAGQQSDMIGFSSCSFIIFVQTECVHVKMCLCNFLQLSASAKEEMQKHLLARYRHGSVSVVFDVVPQEVLDETFKNKARACKGKEKDAGKADPIKHIKLRILGRDPCEHSKTAG